jgi:flagellar motor switch/type III secretory pathway protein FliN
LDGSPSITDFDPAQAALLIEFALSGALDKIEAGLGAKISMISVTSQIERFEPLPEPLFTFALPITKPGLLHIHLHLPPGLSLRLANYMNASAARQNQVPEELAALPFSACIRLAAFAFSHASLAELRAGDVILLDQKSAVLPGAALIIGEILAAPLEIKDGNAILMDAPKKAMGTVLEGMTAKGIEALSGQDGLELDKDGIPATVTFELRRFQASLEDLSRYRRGTVVPLGSDGGDLEILANGKAIALGKITAIGNSTGVMVTRLIQRQPTLATSRPR